MRTPLALLIVASAGSAFAADPSRDPATLFPADTLAYAEIADPAATAAMVGAFFDDTPLAGGLGFLHDRRDQLPPGRPMTGPHASGELALLASPELLAECRRLGGVAAALTGFDTAGRPRGAFVVLLGDSHAAGLVVRHFLATSPTLRRVGTVEGHTIYQHRGRPGAAPTENQDEDRKPEREKDEKPDTATPAAGPAEPTFLYAPGVFAVGTGPAAVADVYRRFTGKLTTPNLTAHPQFKTFEPMRKAGVAVFADPAAFDARFAKVVAKAPPASNTETYQAARFLAGLPTATALVGRFHLGADGPALELHLHGPSPLGALLAGANGGPADKADRPQARLTLPAVDDKLKTLLAACDALAKGRGDVGALPGDRLTGEDRKTLAAALAGVSGVGATWPAGAMPGGWPVFALECSSAEAARAFDTAVPAVMKWAYGLTDAPTPALDGPVRGVAFRTGETNHRFHYRLEGTAVLLGPDAEAVARPREPAPGTRSDFALVGSLPMAAFKNLAATPPPPPPAQQPPRVVKSNPPPRGNAPGAGPGPAKAPPATPTDTLLASLATLPPVQLAARSRAGVVEVVISQPGVKTPLAEFAKALLVWVELQGDSNEGRERPQRLSW